MSHIIASCPHCSKKFKVDSRLIGRSTDCNHCQNSFAIGDPADDLDIPDTAIYGNSGEQPFDPLAPASIPDHMPDQYVPPAPAQKKDPDAAVKDWKQEIKQQKTNSVLSGLDRAFLYLGGFLVLLGIVLNFLPLFGTQLARFEKDESIGQWVGLVMGLIGGGLLAASLRKYRLASFVSGISSAVFVLVVFVASIIGSGNRRAQEANENMPEPEVENKIAEFGSPWISEYPDWEGFENMDLMPSIADRWNRFLVADTDISASFLGNPEASSDKLTVARKRVNTRILSADVNGNMFSLTVFEHPDRSGKTENQLLNEAELAIGDIEISKATEVAGFPGREYRIFNSSRCTHGRLFAVNEDIVHIKLTGSSTLVPGAMSDEFLQSLRVEGDTDRSRSLPEFSLSEEQSARDGQIIGSNRDIEALMAELIHTRSQMNFPAQYLSRSAGKDEGNRRFLAHPGKLPIKGVDLIAIKTSTGGTLISNLAPIYEDATDENSIMAPDGYALAGINVNAGSYVRGVQLIFMKINGLGFDTAKIRRTEWFGTPTSGLPEKIGADGRPVYGIWMCRTRACKSIGIIRESN